MPRLHVADLHSRGGEQELVLLDEAESIVQVGIRQLASELLFRPLVNDTQ